MITKPQQRQPDQTHLKLLQMSGDVHPNTGPSSKYPCPVCTCNVTNRGVSYKCTKCYGWVHAKSLITSCSWQTLSTLSSDHLPILIRLQMNTPSNPGQRRTYVNLKKANWDRYRQEVEAALSKRSFPTDCQRDEKIFRTVLLKAASHHIPTGRYRLHEEPVPA